MNAPGPAPDRDWSRRDEARLKDLAEDCLPVAMIALKFGCTEGAIYAKASELGIAIAPNYALGCSAVDLRGACQAPAARA